jgi:hypothetical protein
MDSLQYDVIVVGGGTAGSAAALAAARQGAEVLLVEELNCLGGVSTAGGVGEWFASLEGLGDIFDAVVTRMEQYGARYDGGQFFNPEYLKFVWQEFLEEGNVDILFHASVMSADTCGSEVLAVEIASSSQTLQAEAKYFIDASGEGDMVALAGAEFQQGDPDSSLTLHMSLTGWMYDTGEEQTPYLPESMDPVQSEGDLPGLGSGGQLVSSGRVYMNSTKIMGLDPTDPFSLSRAEREARRQLMRIVHYLQRTRFPTYALASSGAKIGIREGRRVVGEYVLRHEEILNQDDRLTFPDGVVVATSQIDFHSLTEPGDKGWRQRVEPYQIPFRCMVVKGFDNLLVAGKCISTDQIVHSSARMTPTCCGMGQAVGTAVGLAVGKALEDIRDLSMEALKPRLVAEGMELDPGKHQAYAFEETRLEEGG